MISKRLFLILSLTIYLMFLTSFTHLNKLDFLISTGAFIGAFYFADYLKNRKRKENEL